MKRTSLWETRERVKGTKRAVDASWYLMDLVCSLGAGSESRGFGGKKD